MNNFNSLVSGFDFSSGRIDRTEKQWGELISQIQKGNVIPVIGPDLLIEPVDGKNYHELIIDMIARSVKMDASPKSFSQLLYSKKFKQALTDWEMKSDDIYPLINSNFGDKAVPPHHLLKRLLETKRFPFVLTTSFTPIVEQCMNEIWGETRVYQFNNDPQRSQKVGFGDIRYEADLSIPSVYYLFGKVSNEPHRYVLTDMDMMKFCQSWMTGNGVPRTLSECLRNRYLLFLGGTYNDWLFRFIWFSLRQSSIDRPNASMLVVKGGSPEDDSFEAFLERLETFTQNDPESVIEQLERRLSQLEEDQDYSRDEKTEVFLSYSRSDQAIARRLYEELSARNVTVWFDFDAIGGGQDWEQAIESGIRHSMLFVPVLSKNIEREYFEIHEYRKEWSIAAEISGKMGGRTFIYPIAEDGFDFYNTNTNIPKAFKEVNATWFKTEEDIPAIADSILRVLSETKEQLSKLKYGNK